MALSLVTQPVSMAQKVADVVSQTLVEGDIIVPDVKPDVAEVLQADASVFVDEKEIVDGKAKMKGRLEFTILYTAAGGEGATVASITPTLPFEFQYEIGSVAPDDVVRVKTDTPHIEYNVLNSRKLSVKAVVTVNTIAYRLATSEFVTGVTPEDGEDVECLFETKSFHNTLCQSESAFDISEEFELPAGKPPIGEILKYDVRLTPKDAQCISDKVVAKGDLSLTLLYTAALDGSLQYVEYDMGFTEVVAAPGVSEDNEVVVEYGISDTAVQAKPDYDGDNVYVEIGANLSVFVTAGQEVEVSILSDCFAPDFSTEIARKEVAVSQKASYELSNNSMKDTVEFPAEAPNIRQVMSVTAKPHIKAVSVDGGQAEVEGVIDSAVLYLSDDEANPVYSVKKELPFTMQLSVDDSASLTFDVSPMLTHISYNMINEREVETRFNLAIGLKSVEEGQINTICDVQLSERSEVDTEIPSIVIYFVQKDDTLWNVAKRYNVKRSSILSANELGDDPKLTVGQQLLIPKHR